MKHSPLDLADLFRRRLLIVSGKGGVGKTSVSLALARLAADAGKKVIIAEINSEGQAAHLLGLETFPYQPTAVAPNLYGMNITPQEAFEEYVLMQIKIKTLYKVVFENKLVRHFIEATPGLADMVTIGKVYHLTQFYDLVIVDAPATGHGIALLQIPSIVSSATRIGPLKTDADRIDTLLRDSDRTSLVLVTLPEEMPIAEALEMNTKLEEKTKIPLGPVILNQFQETIFDGSEIDEIEGLKDSSVKNVLDLFLSQQERSKVYFKKLTDEISDRPVWPLPALYSSSFGPEEIQTLAARLKETAT